MSPVLAVAQLLLFGITAVSIIRLERNHQSQDRARSLAFGTACVLTTLTTSLLDDSALSITTAASAALALGTLPLVARLLHPAGIDRLDTVVPAFVGFVVGASSWGLAWQATSAAAAITGLYAAIGLIRHDDVESRVPFGSILVGVALVGTTATAIFT